MPDLLMETVILPAVVTVTPNDHDVPLPVKLPLVTEPVPLVTVMSVAVNSVTALLKVKVMPVVLAVPSTPPIWETV